LGDPGCPSGTSSAPEIISSSMHYDTLPGAPGSPTRPIWLRLAHGPRPRARDRHLCSGKFGSRPAVRYPTRVEGASVRHSGRCAVLAGGNRPERLKSHTVKEIAPQSRECSEKCAECNGRGARGVPDFEKYCRGSTRPGCYFWGARSSQKSGDDRKCSITESGFKRCVFVISSSRRFQKSQRRQ
jgi:hypothetical protein